MKKYKHLSNLEKQEIIIKHFEKRISQADLSKIYDTNKVTINRLCRSHGVSPLKDVLNGGGWNTKDLDVKEIVRLYLEEDMSIKSIADKLKVNFTVINSRLRSSGIKLKDKYQLPKWKKIPKFQGRLIQWQGKIIERDNFICLWCKTDKLLETHHIIPIRNIKEEYLLFSLENGITLCHSCHQKVKWKEKQFEKFFHNLIQTKSSV